MLGFQENRAVVQPALERADVQSTKVWIEIKPIHKVWPNDQCLVGPMVVLLLVFVYTRFM